VSRWSAHIVVVLAVAFIAIAPLIFGAFCSPAAPA
jgi:hypothetical protein